eukprot:1055650-Rhodomonas_salina.2
MKLPVWSTLALTTLPLKIVRTRCDSTCESSTPVWSNFSVCIVDRAASTSGSSTSYDSIFPCFFRIKPVVHVSVSIGSPQFASGCSSSMYAAASRSHVFPPLSRAAFCSSFAGNLVSGSTAGSCSRFASAMSTNETASGRNQPSVENLSAE